MSLSEAETRRRFIDENLRLAGWNVKDPTQVSIELEIDLQKAHKPANPDATHQFADYALLLGAKPRAVVEAKKTSKDAQVGKEQAKQYAEHLQQIHGGPIPFTFYTNGYDNYFWDLGTYPPEKIYGFPTRDDLEWMGLRRDNRRPLSEIEINTDIIDRHYSIAGVRKILEEVEKRRRRFLLVMATGTGKTRTAVALVDALKRGHWVKRVLFLVDRIALRNQAIDAFKEFLPSEPIWPSQTSRKEEFSKNKRIYVTTYPTMLNLIQDRSSPRTWISPFFFDLVIADESHRSLYNKYKQILDYFYALKFGLTATPKDHVDFNTYGMFSCDVGDPTFEYEYEDAIAHDPPYLTDFEVLQVRSKFQLEGIHGDQLPESIQQQLLAEGKELEDIDFEGTDIERKVTNSGTNALIVREFMEECNKDAAGVIPGKTIIFAMSQAHARRLEEIFNKLYPEYGGELARVVLSGDKYVHGKGGLLDQFKNKDMPRVAISVDMLDTGVDIREVVNLVFAKPVYSYVKFWQMIGRGTRVLDTNPAKRKPWCREKDRFLIIDCWGNFDFFKMNPRGREPNAQVPLPVKLFRARLSKLQAAIQVGDQVVADRTKKELRAQIDALPANNVVVSDAASLLAKVKPDGFWSHLKQSGIDYLHSTIAPLMRAQSGLEPKSLRLEVDAVEAGRARLQKNDDALTATRESIVTQVSELPMAVNIVQKEEALITSVLEDAWWDDPSEEKLDALISKLAPLMKYREQYNSPMMKLDIGDLLGQKETVEFGPENKRMEVSAYREKVEAYVRGLLDENPVLQKLKAGAELTTDEVQELAALLESHDPYATEDLLRRIYDNTKAKFINFIRHILGLEVLEAWSEVVGRAFDEFIASHTTFSSLQIQFLQTLRTFIIQSRSVEKANLIQAPFTQLHPKGIRGVFAAEEIEEVLAFAEELVAA